MPRRSGPIKYFIDADPPPLRRPYAIAAFGGWVDAGAAGTGAVRHLITTLGSRKLADISGEDFYSYTDTRPLSTIESPGKRLIQWPSIEFHAATMPETFESDLIVFVAPEPNLRWQSCARAILDVLKRFETRELLCVGSILGMTHHRAPVPLTGWATDEELRQALLRRNIGSTSYEGPTGFATILLEQSESQGVPAATVYGFSPNYIQGVPNPRVSLALLKAVSRLTGAPLPLTDLERASRALTRQVDKLLIDQPELREQVERMLNRLHILPPPGGSEDEESATATAEQEESGPPIELPSPQAVMEELESFLRQLREPGSDPSEPPSGT